MRLLDGRMFMEKLAEHQLGLAMRKEYDIDENFFHELWRIGRRKWRFWHG